MHGKMPLRKDTAALSQKQRVDCHHRQKNSGGTRRAKPEARENHGHRALTAINDTANSSVFTIRPAEAKHKAGAEKCADGGQI